MGIDEMIHLGYTARRMRGKAREVWKAWSAALSELWAPILASMLIVTAGFSLFLLLQFSAYAAPWCAGLRRRRHHRFGRARRPSRNCHPGSQATGEKHITIGIMRFKFSGSRRGGRRESRGL